MKQLKLKMPVRYLINTVLIIAFLTIGTILMDSGILWRSQSKIILQIGVYMILAVSLNIATGYLGQLPLGHAGFIAAGGYAGAIFWKATPDNIFSVLGGLLFAGLVAAVFGILIGIPALRLRGDYLAIITLGFGEIIRIAIVNFSGITGGAPGLKGIPKHSDFPLVYSSVVVICVCIHMLMKSRHGRAILSIRENEIAAESCGIKTTYYKVLAFTASAFFAGIAGALYAGNQGILTPQEFGFVKSIDILVMVVLGGMGSMIGSVAAAAILTALPLLLQIFLSEFNSYRLIIYSLLLILVMIFKPSGLFGTYDFSLSFLIERLIGKSAASVAKGGKGNGAKA